MKKIIEKKQIDLFYKGYSKKKLNKLIENSVTKNGIKNTAFNNDMKRFHNFEFSVEVKKTGITNQKNSGRCWLFSALNMMKTKSAELFNLENFEYSQNYLLFWDKIEKSNTILQLIIDNPNLDFNDRLFILFMDFIAEDGGYWEWAQGLINKYGIVPKSIMNETFHSENTNDFNALLKSHLVGAIKLINEAQKANKTEEDIYKIKANALENVFEICAKVLGLPPREFDFEYHDKDKKFVKVSKITPLEFLHKYFPESLEDKINLLHDPREKYPLNRIYKSKYFNSVVEMKNVTSLNTTLENIKNAIVKSLQEGKPVWFDCDVSAFGDRESGILDTNLFHLDDLFNPIANLSKKDRVNYRLSAPNHAMTFVGVDLDENGKPTKWEVENSWGEKNGKNGYFSMSDDWFNEYCFGAIVDKKYVNPEILKAFDEPAIELEPWDILA